MHVFMDESGAFIPVPAGRPKVSAVVALVLPTMMKDEICKAFSALRDGWGMNTAEVKGSAASPEQVAAVIDLLRNYDGVFVEATAIDTGKHTTEDLRAVRERQAALIEAAVTPAHHQTLRDEVAALAERIRALPEQLALQIYPLILTIERVLRSAVIFYVIRTPAELGEFHWVVDAKDKNVTDFEDLWTTLMGPFLHAIFVRHPTDVIQGYDYSHLKRFSADLTTVGAQLRATIERDNDEFTLDMRRMLGDDFAFRASKDEPCLQAVDILASAVTRALNGSLDEAGWAKLGQLFIGRRHEPAVRLVQIRPQPSAPGEMVRERSYHGYVTERIDRTCRSMFP